MDLTANKFQTKDIAYIGIFTALMAICSWISLPLPSGIPVTLQTFGVFLAVGILGGRRGTLAVASGVPSPCWFTSCWGLWARRCLPASGAAWAR